MEWIFVIGSSVALWIFLLEGTGQGLPLVLGDWAQPYNGAGSSRCRSIPALSAIHRGTRGFQDVGAQYGRLYAKRTRSDYKYETPVTREDAKRAVDDAKWVVSRLGKIRDKDFSSFPILPRR